MDKAISSLIKLVDMFDEVMAKNVPLNLPRELRRSTSWSSQDSGNGPQTSGKISLLSKRFLQSGTDGGRTIVRQVPHD